MKQTLTKEDRIHRRGDLTAVFRRGRSASDGLLRLLVLPNGLGRSRMAVAVSSRHGNAVRRNRLKRLCREAFRASRNDLPAGYDYVMQPRVGAELTIQSLRQSLPALARGLIEEYRP